MSNPNTPAFPVDRGLLPKLGLTKREYFAAMIANGLSANSIPGSNLLTSQFVQDVLERTDALLKALDEEEQ